MFHMARCVRRRANASRELKAYLEVQTGALWSLRNLSAWSSCIKWSCLWNHNVVSCCLTSFSPFCKWIVCWYCHAPAFRSQSPSSTVSFSRGWGETHCSYFAHHAFALHTNQSSSVFSMSFGHEIKSGVCMHSCIDIHTYIHTHTHYIGSFFTTVWSSSVLRAESFCCAGGEMPFEVCRIPKATRISPTVYLRCLTCHVLASEIPRDVWYEIWNSARASNSRASFRASPKPPFGSVQTRKICAIAGWSEEILSCNILWMLSQLCEVSCRCEGFHRAGQLLSETKSLNNLLGHSSLGLRVGTFNLHNQLELLQISSNTLFWLESKLLILRGQVIHFECP